MKIEKWKGNVKGGISMENVISLKNYIDTKETRVRSYSILDKILDPKKKKEADDFYNKNYEYIEKDDFSKKLFKK